jgi:hypothetical protein
MTQTPANTRHAALPGTSVPIARPMRASALNGAGSVALVDLSRFVGEGGPEAPIPEQVDVPINNAIGRRGSWAAGQTNQKTITL